MRTETKQKMANPIVAKWLTYPQKRLANSLDQTIQIVEWCPHTDSNRGPTDYKSVALPTEL